MGLSLSMPTILGLAAVIGPAILGCAQTQGARVAADVAVIREERAHDKLLERGRAFAAIGDYTRAEQYLMSAMEAGSDPKVVLPLLLKICVADQRIWVAIAYAEPYLRRDPDDFRLRFVVASLYSSIGDPKIAREHLERVVAMKPDHADAHYALAVLHRDDEHDPVLADLHFREYLRVEPRGPHAAEARGALLKTVPLRAPEPGSAAPDPEGARPVRVLSVSPDAAPEEPVVHEEPPGRPPAAPPAPKNPPEGRASKPR